MRSPNLVAGANRVGWHVKNVNVPRDYTPDVVAEITNAREGDPCIRCGSPVKLRKGIEVGNIFKLGTDFTDAFGSMYLGEDGERHPIVMGSYGIGVGRNVACIVEAHHDEKGIVWPEEVAPYAAHLVAIGASKEPRVTEVADAAPRPRPGRRLLARHPLRRPRRVARREVHRRRAARDAVDPDGLAALAGRRRRRGHEPGDRRALDAADRGGRGADPRRGPAGGDAELSGALASAIDRPGLRFLGGLLGAALASVVLVAGYALLSIPAVQRPLGLGVLLGPNGFPIEDPLGTALAWAAGPLAAFVAGWFRSPRVVARRPWAGAVMGALTYVLGIVFGVIGLALIDPLVNGTFPGIAECRPCR